MSKLDSPLRTLVAPGELRPDVLMLLASALPVDVLLAAPGLMEPHDGLAPLARTPGLRLSKERAQEHARALLEQFIAATDRLPHTAEWEAVLTASVQALDDGTMQIRHFGRHPLHSRLLSFPDRSVIPQAPLSLDLHNSLHELRVELRGAEHARARAWFEQSFERGVDVSDDVNASLRASWAGSWCTPYELYYYVLSQYFRDVVNANDADDDNPLLEHLTEFQREAYDYARSILARFGGVFLADVVGLGKTFIALALLAHMQRKYAEHAVVIAPPGVLPMWKELADEFRINLPTVSLGKLEDLDQHADREIVVVDESHNFRNKGTLRYEILQEWLRPGGTAASHRKVILLSATPQNNSAFDIESQLRFFPNGYAPLPHRGESLNAFFRDVVTERASLVELLQKVVVRRTRGYIKREYPDAKLRVRVAPNKYVERPLRFPTRISGDGQCLRYAIEKVYGGFFDRILQAIATMRYPLHGLGQYVMDRYKDDARVAGLRRSGVALRGLFRVLLLKRLESSTFALRRTLQRLDEKLQHSCQRLEHGEPLDEPDPTNSNDEAETTLDGTGRGLPQSLFDVDKLRSDLDADRTTVRALLKELDAIAEHPDTKLMRLEAYLEDRPPTRHRTLIFTQFADTANHLASRLTQRFGRTEVVTGSSGHVLERARRFAPRANRRNVPEDQQIDLLIATDVLSEGMNLQDADTLINYDLHWNPLRLIQRAGRIDRLSTEHEEIHIASFLPQRELEANLGLEAILRRRIEDFIAVFGEDSHILPSSEGLAPEEMTSAYTGRALADADATDEFDALSRHMDQLYRLRRSNPAEFSRICALRPGRRALGTLDEAVAATCYDTYWEFWAPAGDGEIRRVDVRSAFDILARQAAAGESPHVPRPGLGLDLIEHARREFEPLAAAVEQQRREPRLSAHEQFVLTSLEALRKDADPSEIARLNRMEGWVRAGHAQAALRKQARVWKRDKLLPQLVLEELRPLVARFPMPHHQISEPEVVGAIISDSTEGPTADDSDSRNGG